MKILRFIILILFCSFYSFAPSWASVGLYSSSYPEDFTMSSGPSAGTSNLNFSVAGESVIGTISSSNYSSTYGITTAIYASVLPGPDIVKPKIQTLLFDGNSFKSGDYVSSGVVITAKVSDESGIDAAGSYVNVDGISKSFASLSAPSSFNASTGSLAYAPSFTQGAHVFYIYAVDISGNTTSMDAVSLNVSDSALSVVNGVNNFPNPFAPPAQKTMICYMLSKDTEAKIYIFNIVSQLVKKFDIASGQEGGHAGYNQVSWDGISDFLEVLPNDVYLCRVVAAGRVIGKCKIAILK